MIKLRQDNGHTTIFVFTESDSRFVTRSPAVYSDAVVVAAGRAVLWSPAFPIVDRCRSKRAGPRGGRSDQSLSSKAAGGAWSVRLSAQKAIHCLTYSLSHSQLNQR